MRVPFQVFLLLSIGISFVHAQNVSWNQRWERMQTQKPWFPADFQWGVASSAYQIEGAVKTGGRGPGVWDTFASIPGKIKGNATGDVATDHYNRFKEDVALIKKLGVQVYRFSISWSRIMPQGRGKVSMEGIAFYHRLLDELIRNGITPYATLFHWNTPTALEMEMDGFMNSEIQDIFADYAEVCFKHFGGKIKHWITLNEPYVYSLLGYGLGMFPPARRSNTEPYIVAHNLLLSHAKAVQRYRTKYQKVQRGVIGITNNCDWREPMTNTTADRDAAQRGLEFYLGWFADPVYKGKYPDSMVKLVGNRLPNFTEAESKLINGSADFFGLNHYTTHMAKNKPESYDGVTSDYHADFISLDTWEKSDFHWNIVPWGFRKLLVWIKDRYNDPEIYVTENGVAVGGEDDVNKAKKDWMRVKFYRNYIDQMRIAMKMYGVKVRGYFAWSILDNFEWAEGYDKRFGICHVDFKTLKRTPKWSYWDFQRIVGGGKPWPAKK